MVQHLGDTPAPANEWYTIVEGILIDPTEAAKNGIADPKLLTL
jgi:hypothetical protein